MSAHIVGNDLNRNIVNARRLDHALQLRAHDAGSANHPVQNRLIKDRRQRKRRHCDKRSLTALFDPRQFIGGFVGSPGTRTLLIAHTYSGVCKSPGIAVDW